MNSKKETGGKEFEREKRRLSGKGLGGDQKREKEKSFSRRKGKKKRGYLSRQISFRVVSSEEIFVSAPSRKLEEGIPFRKILTKASPSTLKWRLEILTSSVREVGSRKL